MSTARTNLEPACGVGPFVGQKLVVSWTSDGSGNYTEAIIIRGFIAKVTTNPTDSPTGNYDLTLVDEDGVDILGGAGADRDTTTSEQIPDPTTGKTIAGFGYGSITFTIANAGNAKSGTATIIVLNP